MDWKSKRATAILEQALLEDRATADATTALTIDPDLPASASVLAKQDCVLAGIGLIPRVFQVFAQLDSGRTARRFEVISHPEIFDSVPLRAGQVAAVIRHNARTILACERVILNLLQRMCGIATLTRQYVDAVRGAGATILDTRKTAPGLRLLDKYAVTCGGGANHRMDLADGVLIKNNHIALGGGMDKVLARALSLRKPGQKIQVEVRTPEELTQALNGGADSLLLDNMTPAEVRRAVVVARKHSPKIPLEASGGMTLETVRAYAKTGVDFLSVGALTHSVPAVDLSLRITADLY
jgi:nicotinate-nucleotide pyrophosphorylase (carboxylating)